PPQAGGHPGARRPPPRGGMNIWTGIPTDSPAPPTRGPLRTFLRRRLEGWMLRHQLPFNFWIHMLGIPIAYGGLVLLFFLPWYWGVGAFVLGFVLQWVGHPPEAHHA